MLLLSNCVSHAVTTEYDDCDDCVNVSSRNRSNRIPPNNRVGWNAKDDGDDDMICCIILQDVNRIFYFIFLKNTVCNCLELF